MIEDLKTILGIEGADRDKELPMPYFYLEENERGSSYRESGCDLIETANYKLIIISKCKPSKTNIIKKLQEHYTVTNSNFNSKAVYKQERKKDLKSECYFIRVDFSSICPLKNDCNCGLFKCDCS